MKVDLDREQLSYLLAHCNSNAWRDFCAATAKPKLERALAAVKSIEKKQFEISAIAARVQGPPSDAEMRLHQFKPWPKDMPLKYNGVADPCDMWTGPCLCGAWHTEGA